MVSSMKRADGTGLFTEDLLVSSMKRAHRIIVPQSPTLGLASCTALRFWVKWWGGGGEREGEGGGGEVEGRERGGRGGGL